MRWTCESFSSRLQLVWIVELELTFTPLLLPPSPPALPSVSHSMIHQQYSQHPTLSEEFWRLANAVPRQSALASSVVSQRVAHPLFLCLSPLPHYLLQCVPILSFPLLPFLSLSSARMTRLLVPVPRGSFVCAALKTVSSPITQYSLAALSVSSGARLIYIINKAGWLVIMRQVRPSSLPFLPIPFSPH